MSAADLTNVLTTVYTLTNRPDLVNESTLAVQQSTLLLHRRENWAYDLTEIGWQFPLSSYQQQIALADIPNFRKIKYLRKYDSVNLAPGDYLTEVSVEQSFNKRWMQDNVDCYYFAGAVYNINMSTSEQYLLMGYYADPDVTTTNYTSWIGVKHPGLVAARACTMLAALMEKEAFKQSMGMLYQEELTAFDGIYMDMTNK